MATDLQLLQIDVLELARAALGDRQRFAAITRAELVALLGFVLQENGEPLENLAVDFPDMLALASAPQPALPASVAASLALYLRLKAEHLDLQFESNAIDNFERREAIDAAFKTLKTRFEEEFPNAGN